MNAWQRRRHRFGWLFPSTIIITFRSIFYELKKTWDQQTEYVARKKKLEIMTTNKDDTSPNWSVLNTYS